MQSLHTMLGLILYIRIMLQDINPPFLIYSNLPGSWHCLLTALLQKGLFPKTPPIFHFRSLGYKVPSVAV